MSAPQWGHVAEWLRSGLQNRLHQFNSGRGLHHLHQWLIALIAPAKLSLFFSSGTLQGPGATRGLADVRPA